MSPKRDPRVGFHLTVWDIDGYTRTIIFVYFNNAASNKYAD